MADAVAEIKQKLRTLRQEFEDSLAGVGELAALQGVRDRFLGRRSGRVTALLRGLGKVDAEARKELGRELNAVKAELEERLASAKQRLESRLREAVQKMIAERSGSEARAAPPMAEPASGESGSDHGVHDHGSH